MKRDRRGHFYALIASYLGVITIFIVAIVGTPYWMQRYEQNYMNAAETAIYTAIKTTPAKDLITNIQQIKEQYPIEIALYDGDKVIYRTLPGDRINSLLGTVDKQAIIHEVQGDIVTDYGRTIRCWYVIYHPKAPDYLSHFMQVEMIVLGFSFVILLLIIFLLQRMTIKPLAQVRQSIMNLSEYKFTDIPQQAEDVLNAEVQQFAVSLKDNIKAVSRTHSTLEQALQLERERLSNLLIIARGLIHDLKTPVHQTLLENDILLQEDAKLNKQATAIVGYNITRSEKLMEQINDILHLLDTDVSEMMEVADTFDIIAMYKEIRNSFTVALSNNELVIDSQVDERLDVHVNKVAVHLILHNMLSNAVKYAAAQSDIEIEIYEEDQKLYLYCENFTTMQNIDRIQHSEDIFYAMQDNQDPNEEYIYSTGNGLYLIKELANILEGEYELTIEDLAVQVKVIIPLQK